MKTVILVNVGTPQSPSPEDVGIYLKEFLMDKNIIPIPRPFRDLLVKGLIVPKRKFSSSEKYQEIWTPKGSPLMVFSLALKEKLQNKLGSQWNVVLGMQVGKPSLKEVIQTAIQNKDEIYFCPLYPQYAVPTTGGAIEALGGKPAWILSPFYKQPWFIKSQAQLIQKKLKPQDHLLLSFHGLPVSKKSQRYYNECLETAELIKQELSLSDLSVGFQSRLGRGKWLEPSTEFVLEKLIQKGIKNVKVACPSFVADCLETLEEIGIGLKKQFLSSGGESFELVECINDDEVFVEGLASSLGVTR